MAQSLDKYMAQFDKEFQKDIFQWNLWMNVLRKTLNGFEISRDKITFSYGIKSSNFLQMNIMVKHCQRPLPRRNRVFLVQVRKTCWKVNKISRKTFLVRWDRRKIFLAHFANNFSFTFSISEHYKIDRFKSKLASLADSI